MELAIQITAWAVLAICVIGGVVGSFLPLVPGPVLIAVGALVHRLLLPHWLSWWVIIALGVLVIVERAADLVGTMLGAKWLGATRWGIVGACLGGIIGIFFGIPGLLLGPLIGAAGAEVVVARRRFDPAMRAGFGATIGVGIATAARVAIAMWMVAMIAFDLIW